jgi:uncharacterized membrane protein
LDLEFLFKYLGKKNISIDKKEFSYQFNSHPDYPSLLAISDTLSFFNIGNAALRVGLDDFAVLPDSFVARLKTKDNDFFSFVEKDNNEVAYTLESTAKRKKTDVQSFREFWDNIVLLVENSETIKVKKKSIAEKALQVTTVSLLIIVLIQTSLSLKTSLFYIFSGIGFLLGLSALRELFNKKSSIIDKFCQIAKNTSCSSVLNSKKWKIFSVLSFSDLAIIFFSSQLVGMFLFSLNAAYKSFFQIQLLTLLFAMPVMVLSIYYQGFVERKWCPICLAIIAVVVTQLGYLIVDDGFNFSSISFSSTALYGFVFAFLALVWFYLKPLFENLNRLRDLEITTNRFKRNYRTFKLLLTSENRYKLPKSKLILGNKDASLKIAIITSPFCGHCEKPYKLLKTIERKYGEQLQVSVFYNVKDGDDWLKRFLSILIEKTLNNREDYYNAMDYWYEVKKEFVVFSKYF